MLTSLETIQKDADVYPRHSGSLNPKFLGMLAALFVGVGIVLWVNAASVSGYFYYLVLTVILYRLVIGKRGMEPVFLYVIYSLLVISVYLFQYWSLPEYLGLSGPFGIGTDDTRYYWEVADALPPNFPSLPFYDIVKTNYSKFIRFVTVFPVSHPFDVLFFNALAAVFVPVFTREVAFILTGQRRVAQTAFRLVAICPFVLSNSLILIRDGWAATLCIGAVYFLLKKRYLFVVALTALLFYLRVGSGLLSLIVAFFFTVLQVIRSRTGSIEKFFYVCGIGVVGVLVALALFQMVYSYMEQKAVLENLLFRVFFFEEYVARYNPNSELVKIYRHGFLARILLGVPYFLSTPFFSWDAFRIDGVWIPRGFLINLFAVAFVFYFGGLIQGIFKAWQNKDLGMKTTTIAFLVSILAISQLSLQLRHKTMLMPLFYIIVAYGYHNRNSLGTIFGRMGMAALVAIQVFVLLRGG
jgi:hypothetical protein